MTVDEVRRMRVAMVDEVRARWLRGEGWPPGVPPTATAVADAKFLLAEVERLRGLIAEIRPHVRRWVDNLDYEDEGQAWLVKVTDE